jgi:hypothetical protein
VFGRIQDFLFLIIKALYCILPEGFYNLIEIIHNPNSFLGFDPTLPDILIAKSF